MFFYKLRSCNLADTLNDYIPSFLKSPIKKGFDNIGGAILCTQIISHNNHRVAINRQTSFFYFFGYKCSRGEMFKALLLD